MAKRNHLRLLAEKQIEEVSTVKFNYGFQPQNEDEQDAPNYFYMATNLRNDIQKYSRDIAFKYQNRSNDIDIPADIDYIEIEFIDQFVIKNFWEAYYWTFGLMATSFSNFGRIGLFAIVEKELFKVFFNDINSFIAHGLDINPEAVFSNYITYINSFKLLTSRDIIKFDYGEVGHIIQISLIDLPYELALQQKVIKGLLNFLNSAGVEAIFKEESNKIEVSNASSDLVKTIAENFDIIQSITCSLSSVVSPSRYNIVERGYGFKIDNIDEDLPVIGIIDTGISMDTPLRPIVIQDTSFSIAGNPLVDIVGLKREGHGTAVAALAALGRVNHANQFSAPVNADAKLLSIKVSESGGGYISEVNLMDMLYRAKEVYPNLQLFVLTMCYQKPNSSNASFSNYTYELDLFAHRTNSLVVICTGNNNECIYENNEYDLNYFKSPHTNLCTPADSLNNITVGAAADNLKSGVFCGISTGREFPTLYSRKSHIDLSAIYPPKKINKNYFKPDVIECGGDIGYYKKTNIDWTNDSAMDIMSARPEVGFIPSTGTSFAAPLVANLAAKLIRQYPDLNIQTIKALIINGASLTNIRFPDNVKELLNATSGHGFVDVERTVFSEDSSPTFILEDSIKHDEIKIYPINFPDYLIDGSIENKRGIIKISGTLCFSFEPIPNNQLSYNPIHMAFSFFKNHTAEQINSKKDIADSKLRSNINWSQNGRYVSKTIPYSNSQKINFSIDLAHLISENKTLKLAVQCRLTEQIMGGVPSGYPKAFPFSLVIRFEENFKKNGGRLYDELLAVNHLEVIQRVDLEGEIDI